MKFYAIVPFLPSNVDFMVGEYRRFAEASGQTLLLPSMSLNPEGENPFEKVDLFVTAYAELKEKLRGSPVRLGVLLQSLIGHGWSSSNPAGNRFQTTVNHTGGTRGRICPLDENFLAYCEYAVGALAKCNPELFLLDDDTRLIDNNLLECFCPLHLAKFPAAYTREELTDLVIHAKPGDAILREFETVRRDSLEQFCRRIRAAIDAVNPALPCGLSGAGREHILFERMALAASGPHTEPFVRLGNALYFEGSAKVLPRRFYLAEIQKKGCGSVRLLLDEADTFPQHRYSKSASGMHSHITTAILHGLGGAKTWISNFLNPVNGTRNPRYEATLRENMPFYQTLRKLCAEVVWKGPSTPLPNLEKNFHPLEYPDYFTCQEWQSDVLGRLGIPGTFREPGDPAAECFLLTGELLKHFTDGELSALLHRNLFLDAAGAEFLAQNGHGELLGVALDPDCPHFSCERDAQTSLKMRLLFSPKCRKLVPRGKVEILSNLNKIPFSGSPEEKTVAPGCTKFRNRFGKTVVVWAGSIDLYTVSPERRQWLMHILNDLAEIPASCENDQDVLFRCGVLPDGSLLAASVNLSYDAMEEIRLRCRRTPCSVSFLRKSGDWENVGFSRSGETICVNLPCGAYLPAVLRLS